MKRPSRLLLAAATVLAVGTGTGPLAAAVPETSTTDAAARQYLEPRDLPRGPDVAVPHVEGSTFVDGDRRVDLGAARVALLGTTADGHLVRTSRDDGRRGRVLRLLPDDTTEVLLRGRETEGTVLSADGRRLVQARTRAPRSGTAFTRVASWDARTGRLRHEQRLPGYADLLDSTARKALVSTQGRTSWLDLRTGRRTLLVARSAGAADIASGRLATWTGDPYQGGCMVVSTLERPRRATWRSCEERVDTFSPDGTHMTTIDLLADGLGPGTVWLRTVQGRRLGEWSTAWFGATLWEGPGTVLLQTNGRRSASVVRCTPASCENATDPGPVSMPRRAA